PRLGRSAVGTRRRGTGIVGGNRRASGFGARGRRGMRFLVLAAALAGPAAADPAFVDRAAALPVQHVYDGGWEHFVGGGVAVFDCDGDDRPEILAAGGSNPARLFRNTTPSPGAPVSFDEAPLPALTD